MISGWPFWQRSEPGHFREWVFRLECKGVGHRVPALWKHSWDLPASHALNGSRRAGGSLLPPWPRDRTEAGLSLV